MDLPLRHSVQNIFFQVGQFDRFAIFDFYYGSEAYKKYGPSVYGHVRYSPTGRAKLQKEIDSGQIGNDDGSILIDGAIKDPQKNELLMKEGFYARDIARLATMDHGEITNEYENDSLKQIPNTINIPFQSDPLASQRLELLMFRKRVEENIPFIPAEERRFYALRFVLEPGTVSDEDKERILINPETGRFYDDAVIGILGPLLEHDRKNPAIQILNEALFNRRIKRINTICKHLGIAPKHIERLRSTNEPAWKELMNVVYSFEDETLTLWGWQSHVYWDFERFIHIYMRHYKNFLIHESSRGQGTGFQYTRKDIRRIINIVLNANKETIENRLSMGKTFQLKGDAGYYFNGNYYSLIIAADGKLMQFHPQEKV